MNAPHFYLQDSLHEGLECELMLLLLTSQGALVFPISVYFKGLRETHHKPPKKETSSSVFLKGVKTIDFQLNETWDEPLRLS